VLRETPVALALGLAWGFVPAIAQAQTATPPASATPAETTSLKEITVTSTRTPRKTDNVPNTVTVETAGAIEESGARDVKDVFRNELDVTVPSGPTRFSLATPTGRAGNEGINIRGLEGNQVLMLIDGIRVANSFTFGSFATGRGDFFDISGAQTIEVLRGPASTQYGSDGLAGAVSFRTLDPADLIRKDRDAGGAVVLGYNQVDKSWNTSLAGAGRSGAWQGLLLGTVRQGHELANKGDDDAPNVTRTTPNPADTKSRYLLGKLYVDLNRENRLGLTLESQDRKQDTEVLSARAVPPLVATSTLDLVAHDRVTRDRVSFEHRFTDLNALWLQRATTQVYSQDSKVGEVSLEDRNTAPDRTRDNTYRQKLVGLSTQLETHLVGAAANQRLSYGFDWSRATVTGLRDGTVPPFGETFPTRPFPDTRYTLAGAFVQDEIEAGTFSVIPALRFDQYQLDPSPDGYTGAAVTSLSDEALTPRIGIVWRLADVAAPYAQYSKGFRAPTPDQVNNGFTNVAAGYRSIGNPNLKAERAESFEIGMRGKVQTFRFALAAYDNRYEDFISQQVVGGSGAPNDPLVFQYINLAKAHIRGAEAKGDWQVDSNWNVNGGVGWSRGDSESARAEVPLDSIQPWRAVLGLRYDAPTWGARATFLHSAGKALARIAPATPSPFAPGAYTVLDLGASWKPLPSLTIVANLNNVFDQTYWRWSDVRGLADASPIKDAYTAPGRNAQVSIHYAF
jgi:hemoglobin/transferrin/lactoferrin receptor protein